MSDDLVTLAQLETRFPALKGFALAWQSKVTPALKDLEKQRRQALDGFWLRFLIGGAATAAITYGAGEIFDQAPEAYVFAFFIGAVVTWLWSTRRLSALRSQAKGLVVGTVCKSLGLTHSSGVTNFPFENFLGIGLLPGHSSRRLEDQIEGTLAGVPLRLCEARLIQRTTGHKGRSQNVTVFNGLLMELPLPGERLNQQILIRPDWGWVGNLFAGIGKPGAVVPFPENAAFEKRFQVYSPEPAQARFRINPILQSVLLNLAEIAGKTPSVALREDKLLLALPRQGDAFEPVSAFRAFDKAGLAERIVKEVSFLAQIVECLRLPPAR